MRLTAPIQLLIVALTVQSSASPVAAPPSVDVASRDFTEISTDTASIEKRSFQRSCRNKRLDGKNTNSPTLSAECRAPGGAYVKSSLPLNNCIANRNGVMKWVKGGNFGPTCFDVFFQIHPNTLMATCYRPDRSKHTSELNWDNVINNRNGLLTCF